ncbi:MAG: phosphoribosyltransferase regulatory subunit [Chloroflexota bacterium]|nr:phosphoribosyltransferase regulatory subunit [Chloroflexota bacterium]
MKSLAAASQRLPAAKAPGFVDLLPGQARRRRELEQAMLGTFSAWGYELVNTPAVEQLATIGLGVEPEQLRRLFKFADGDGTMLAMVGERTVPVARLAAGQLRQAPRPLRLCYLGPTYQGHPAAGGQREAFQAGAELVGAHSATADAEVVAMAVGALEAGGAGDFQVEVGHVGFFGGLVAGLAPGQRGQVVDALAGRDLVELEQALAGTDLGAAERELLLRFPALRGDAGILTAAAGLVDNATSALALEELGAVHRLLQAHGVEARVNIDLGAVRDFDYYTGVVFEVFAPGLGAPLATGGRYDNLLQRFGEPEPATGLVVFLDRLQAVLDPISASPAFVLVGYVDDAEAAEAAVGVAAGLRSGGEVVAMEVAPIDDARLRARAAATGASGAVICDGAGAWRLGPDGARERLK